MKSSSKKSPSTAEERSARIKQLQAWLLCDIYPAGETRATIAKELMKLRNTRKPKGKAEE